MRGSSPDVRAPTFEAQLERALTVLREKGVRDWAARPPLYRLPWALGVRLPPPQLAGSVVPAVLSGGVLVVIMWSAALVMQLVDPSSAALRIRLQGFTIAGIVFGVGVRRAARKHDLPRWEDLARPGLPDDDTAPGSP